MTMQSDSRKTSATKRVSNYNPRVVLRGIDWHAYKTICGAVENRRVHMPYDRGALEIMVASLEHDNYSRLFALIIFTVARVYTKKVRSCGSFTHQRIDLKRGFEPDQCFYLANLAAVKGKKELDLTRDPPPDLSIEIDISHSSLDRMSIFAAVGVPEVWRFDSKTIQVYLLKNGAYEAKAVSPTFPDVPVADLVDFLKLGIRQDNVTMIEELEAWLGKLPDGKGKSGKESKGK